MQKLKVMMKPKKTAVKKTVVPTKPVKGPPPPYRVVVRATSTPTKGTNKK